MTKTNPKAEQPSTDVDKAIEFSLDTGIDVSQEFSSKYIGEYGAWGLGNVLKFTSLVIVGFHTAPVISIVL